MATSKPPKVHIHGQDPITARTPQEALLVETNCSRYKPQPQVVDEQEYRRWIGRGQTGSIFCADCTRELLS